MEPEEKEKLQELLHDIVDFMEDRVVDDENMDYLRQKIASLFDGSIV